MKQHQITIKQYTRKK